MQAQFYADEVIIEPQVKLSFREPGIETLGELSFSAAEQVHFVCCVLLLVLEILSTKTIPNKALPCAADSGKEMLLANFQD